MGGSEAHAAPGRQRFKEGTCLKRALKKRGAGAAGGRKTVKDQRQESARWKTEPYREQREIVVKD